jgi:hypothetical protein
LTALNNDHCERSRVAERSGYLFGRLGVAFIVRATFAVATVRAPCALTTASIS